MQRLDMTALTIRKQKRHQFMSHMRSINYTPLTVVDLSKYSVLLKNRITDAIVDLVHGQNEHRLKYLSSLGNDTVPLFHISNSLLDRLVCYFEKQFCSYLW